MARTNTAYLTHRKTPRSALKNAEKQTCEIKTQLVRAAQHSVRKAPHALPDFALSGSSHLAHKRTAVTNHRRRHYKSSHVSAKADVAEALTQRHSARERLPPRSNIRVCWRAGVFASCRAVTELRDEDDEAKEKSKLSALKDSRLQDPLPSHPKIDSIQAVPKLLQIWLNYKVVGFVLIQNAVALPTVAGGSARIIRINDEIIHQHECTPRNQTLCPNRPCGPPDRRSLKNVAQSTIANTKFLSNIHLNNDPSTLWRAATVFSPSTTFVQANTRLTAEESGIMIIRAVRRARRAGLTGSVRRVADPFRRGIEIFFNGTATGPFGEPTAVTARRVGAGRIAFGDAVHRQSRLSFYDVTDVLNAFKIGHYTVIIGPPSVGTFRRHVYEGRLKLASGEIEIA
ncbi:hypothetical protein C8J57DRAFT_1234094 [Mycena rebaudengoi]|nr:hypothetical protein C8J57DRAFT_1234094 [Mycena rebaudengoi]